LRRWCEGVLLEVTSPEAVLTGNDVTGSEVDYIKGVQGNPRVSHTKQQKDRSRSESYEESQDEFTIQGEDEPITSGEHAIEVVDGRWKICRTHRMEWYEESGPEILGKRQSSYQSRCQLIITTVESLVQCYTSGGRFDQSSERQRTRGLEIPFGSRYLTIHVRKYFVPNGEWTLHPTKTGITLTSYEWEELKKIISVFEDREPELKTMDNK
jgi:hypothetical protein